MGRYGSKIRKVSRGRPTVSNETIQATKQEFFCTKVAPIQSITDIVLLGFWLILFSWMFISSCTTIYFFVNIFFCNVYISVNTIFECSYLFYVWELGHPLSTWATGGMEGVIQNLYRCVRGRGVSRLMCTYALTLSLFVFIFMTPWIIFVHWSGQVHSSITASMESVAVFFHHNYEYLILCDN